MVAADSMCGRIDVAVTAELKPMATSFSSAELERFRREAKRLGRELSITHSEALDRVAARHGYQNWSLLSKHSNVADTPPTFLPHRKPPTVPSVAATVSRYYLHGDVLADDPTKCFCARCDYRVDPSHFDGAGHHGDGEDGARYLSSLAIHNGLPATRKAARYRPDDAPNVLAARAVSERDAYEVSRAPFHRWLEGQSKRDDMVGDLATDILGDRSFPVGLTTRKQVENHLAWHGAHVVRAIRQAWSEFSR